MISLSSRLSSSFSSSYLSCPPFLFFSFNRYVHGALESATIPSSSSLSPPPPPPSPSPSSHSFLYSSPSSPSPFPIYTDLSSSISILRYFIDHSDRLLIITGAGISTDSNIPDYRSPGRPPYKPMQHSTFMNDSYARQRYWTRSSLGYDTIAYAAPNISHFALADYEERTGKLGGIITQNVDELHQKSGSKNVLELHGSILKVRCMNHSCGKIELRESVQQRILRLNPQIKLLYDMKRKNEINETTLEKINRSHHNAKNSLRPDGDIQWEDEELFRSAIIPQCLHCGGILKPDVVFFGGNVPAASHSIADQLFKESDSLLVLGSSLTVWSAFRLIRAGAERYLREKNNSKIIKPYQIGIVTDGVTRADQLDGIQFKITQRIKDILPYALNSDIDNIKKKSTSSFYDSKRKNENKCNESIIRKE